MQNQQKNRKTQILLIILCSLFSVNPIYALDDLQTEIARYTSEGINYHNNRNYILAIRSFEKALFLSPNDKEVAENLSIAHNNYGKYLAERTDDLGSAREFRNSLYYNDSNEIARENLRVKLKEKNIANDDIFKRLVEGKQEKLKENFKAAIAEFREINKIKKNVDAYLEIGTCYHLLSLKTPGNNSYTDMALMELKKAHELDKNDPRPFIKLGDVNVANGKINKGIDYYEEAIKLEPDNVDAQSSLINGWLAALRIAPHLANNHIGLGTAYQLKGDFTQAQRAFTRALQIDPNNQLAMNSMNNLRQDQLKTQVNLLLKRALKAQQEKDYGRSLDLYIEAMQKEPLNADIHYNIGTVFQAQNNFSKAKQAYNRSLELNPNLVEAKQALTALQATQKEQFIEEAFNKAIALQKNDNFDDAIEIYSKIAKDKPQDENLFYNLAVAYQAKKQYAKAIENYQRAYAITPNSIYSDAIQSVKIAEANEILEEAISNQGNAENDKAIANYKKVLEIVPSNANAWYNLGTAYQAVGKDHDALEAYKKAFEIDPKSQSEAIFFAALILEEERKLIEAIDLYDKYLDVAPSGEYIAEAKERKEYIKSFL